VKAQNSYNMQIPYFGETPLPTTSLAKEKKRSKKTRKNTTSAKSDILFLTQIYIQLGNVLFYAINLKNVSLLYCCVLAHGSVSF